MTPDQKDIFTAHFGFLCHTLFKPDKTLNDMFVDGKTAKELFAELSRNLDEIGKIVYGAKWEGLKAGMEKDLF